MMESECQRCGSKDTYLFCEHLNQRVCKSCFIETHKPMIEGSQQNITSCGEGQK